MTVADRIESKLTEAFSPSMLEVIDESHLHKGHTGARPEGETHFRVRLVSARFAGESRIARQRMVHKVLADELAGPVHALALELTSPSEF